MSESKFNIGDIIQYDKNINVRDAYDENFNRITYDTKLTYKGVVVEKQLKPVHERQLYWFADEYNYLVSIPCFGGDYKWLHSDNIKKKLNIPIEEKLALVASFGDWWYEHHKSIYQSLLIEALNY